MPRPRRVHCSGSLRYPQRWGDGRRRARSWGGIAAITLIISLLPPSDTDTAPAATTALGFAVAAVLAAIAIRPRRQTVLLGLAALSLVGAFLPPSPEEKDPAASTAFGPALAALFATWAVRPDLLTRVLRYLGLRRQSS